MLITVGEKMYKIEKEETTKLLMNLVNIDSPYYKEDRIIEYVYDWFINNNIDASIHEYYESKVTDFRGKNVVVVLEGNNSGPVICLNGHLDTVMLCKGWTTNPKGELIGDRLYGVGALI